MGIVLQNSALDRLVLRLQAIGDLSDEERQALRRLPMAIREFGEATGLSTVHVNRSIQKLRTEGLITLEKARCTIDDWDGLVEAGSFDATYLHQRNDLVPA